MKKFIQAKLKGKQTCQRIAQQPTRESRKKKLHYSFT